MKYFFLIKFLILGMFAHAQNFDGIPFERVSNIFEFYEVIKVPEKYREVKEFRIINDSKQDTVLYATYKFEEGNIVSYYDERFDLEVKIYYSNPFSIDSIIPKNNQHGDYVFILYEFTFDKLIPFQKEYSESSLLINTIYKDKKGKEFKIIFSHQEELYEGYKMYFSQKLIYESFLVYK